MQHARAGGADQRDRPIESGSGSSSKRAAAKAAVEPVFVEVEEETESRDTSNDEEFSEADGLQEDAEPELDDAIFTPVEPTDNDPAESVDPEEILS